MNDFVTYLGFYIPDGWSYSGRKDEGTRMVCPLEHGWWIALCLYNIVAAHREWRNALTGSFGFSDPYEMMQLKFDRKEDAIRFCETQGRYWQKWLFVGFKYEVDELPPQFPPQFKQYADKIQSPVILTKMREVIFDRLLLCNRWDRRKHVPSGHMNKHGMLTGLTDIIMILLMRNGMLPDFRKTYL